MIDLNIVYTIMIFDFLFGLFLVFLPCIANLCYDSKYDNISLIPFAVYVVISKNKQLNNAGKIILYILYSVLFCVTQIVILSAYLIVGLVYYGAVLFMKIFSKKE